MQPSLHGLAVTCVAYLALASLAAWRWVAWSGARMDALTIVLCLLPVLIGLLLAATSQVDREQYAVRLFAAAGGLPLLLWILAAAQDGPAPASTKWMVLGALALVHVAAFVALTVFTATRTGRFEPLPGVEPIGAERLGRRFESLRSGAPDLDLKSGPAPLEWTITLRGAGADAPVHRISLQLEPEQRRVRVMERLGGPRHAPRDANEASMRSVAEPWFDPTRPQAQWIGTRARQVTPLEPQRVEAVPLTFRDDRVEPALTAGERGDAETLLTRLAAITTRSGWAWHPALVGGR